jgi:putative peptidoglycan lipid II flippase
MTMAVLMLVSIVAVALIGLEAVVHFSFDIELSERALLTIRLVKTLLPYMIFICGAAFGMGVLNAMGRFKASSAMPCLLNVVWIGILIWICFHPELKLDQRIHRVAMAILVAGAFQMAFMLWCMHRAGVTPGITFKGWRDSKVRLVWKNTAIAAMGAGAVQINYMLDQVLGQIAAPWAAGVIGYAERLMDLPLGVIGVAFGTVLLPTFAGFFSKNDVKGAREAFVSSSKQMLFVMVPAAVGLGVLASDVTAVIYRGGAFDELAVLRVSRAVAVYAPYARI